MIVGSWGFQGRDLTRDLKEPLELQNRKTCNQHKLSLSIEG